MSRVTTWCRRLLAAATVLPLAGCNTVLLHASGDLARQEGDLIVTSFWLMMIIIVPVILLSLFFAWHYRAGNSKATYAPDWHHSTKLELVIWAAPLLIIIALGTITWITTHKLDPYRSLDRLAEGKAVPVGTKPLIVDVAALNKQWLFVYPELGIASVNELAVPVDTPVEFRITSTNVMQSFYVPALAGQIYAMPGMQTQLHAVLNETGDYKGFSANLSGAHFNGMKFVLHGVDAAGFDAWVARVKADGTSLDRATFIARLDPPPANPQAPYDEETIKPEPVQHFASVENGLFDAIVNDCVDSSRMCSWQVHSIDAAGGEHEGMKQEAMVSDATGRHFVANATCKPKATDAARADHAVLRR